MDAIESRSVPLMLNPGFWEAYMMRSCWTVGVGVVVGLTVVLAGAYLLLDCEKADLTPVLRAGLPGQFVDLPGGVTHYQWSGPEGGPVVVLVPGFSVPAYTWDHTVPGLTQAGMRVLTYDLYGRGYSDRPPGPYTIDLFVDQLNDLLTGLGIDQPVDVVGLSMGGYISAAFSARHPERVRRLALIAPQTVVMGSDPLLRAVTLPGVGEYLFTVYLGPFYMTDSSSEFASGQQPADWRERYLDQMQYRGFRNALLSTLRNLNGDPFGAYRAVGLQNIPVLLVWGDQDTTNPYANAPRVQAAIPQADLHVVPGGKHALAYEFPERVNPLLANFLMLQAP